ncbi:hypothetical protein SmJEL517_g04142 [Synchytrium microbalum]|uniref:Uncharacterized protein n=1 Tax=Synchytrium microbalum TaxID=1806994 RepID=A0A507C0E4_9FUNG|nr:uncharacterized protein SmJEL517_g04142 [Synchytrium microbalum]TPX32838.1 hypothetical protein SmJEL517_g04142 [Synchytrium microbalum]
MADARKQELERKRQKLLELRKQKDERKTAAPTARSTLAGGMYQDRSDIDDLVSALIGDKTQSSPTRSSTGIRAASPAVSNPDSTTGGIAASKGDESESVVDKTVEKYVPNLSSVEFLILDIPPKEKVIYSKEVQTSEWKPEPAIEAQTSPVSVTPPQIAPAATPILQTEPTILDDKEAPILPKLTEEEKERILMSDRFLGFFEQSTKIVERALNDRYDFMVDYTAGDDLDRSASTEVKEVCTFYDERWTRNRALTSVGWSPKFPELLLGSYNKNTSSPNDPDGLVLVWNLHLAERPEFIFHAQSDVTSAIFSEFHQNLIVGGTSTGQIVLWDTRSKSIPVLKTPLSSSGHAHPVYGMSMVGTQNAHNLISASTDGMEILELIHPSHPKTPEVSVTCMGFTHTDSSTFWVGTEEGSIYQAFRYDRAGSKAGLNLLDVYKGHYGMITGLHFHPANEFSDLFLSSSVDWTLKLWSAKSSAKPSTSATTIHPIASFENADDHIYDVKWSPVHSGVFASVDASGKFDVYDLTQEAEVPTVSIHVGNGMALNKLDWDKEGRRTALGSSDGYLYVYDVGELSQPRSDHLSNLSKVVNGFETALPSLVE